MSKLLCKSWVRNGLHGWMDCSPWIAWIVHLHTSCILECNPFWTRLLHNNLVSGLVLWKCNLRGQGWGKEKSNVCSWNKCDNTWRVLKPQNVRVLHPGRFFCSELQNSHFLSRFFIFVVDEESAKSNFLVDLWLSWKDSYLEVHYILVATNFVWRISYLLVSHKTNYNFWASSIYFRT